MEKRSLLQRFTDGFKGVRDTGGFTVVEKAKDAVLSLLGPVYREVPPLWNSSKILSEGVQGWAYAAVKAIADDASTNPMLLYSRTGKDWRITEEHMLLDLLNNPNPYQTRETFMWLTYGYLLSVGEAFWILNDSRNPTEMIAYNPTRVNIVYGDDKLISSYQIQLADGKKLNIPADQMVYLKLPDLRNPLRGSGPLASVARSIDTDNFMQEYVRVFFFNSAMPQGVLETDGDIDDDAGRQIIKSFETRHRGVRNSNRIALLTNGMKFRSIDHSFNDLQMDQTEMRLRDRILGVLKVPKNVLGITEDVNRANAEATDRNFAKRAVYPNLVMIQGQINQSLIPKFSDGRNLYFEYQNPVMEDQLTMAQVREINVRTGIRTADEYRAEDGLAPLGLPYPANAAPLALAPADTQKAYQTSIQKKLNHRINRMKFLSVGDKSLREIDMKILEKAGGIARKAIEKKYAALEAEIAANERHDKAFRGPFTEKMNEEYHLKKLQITDPIEKDFAGRIEDYHLRQFGKILLQLTGKSRKKAALSIEFDEEEEAAVLASLTQPFLERSLLAQAALSAAFLNIDNTLDTQDERVRNFLKKWSVRLGKTHNETTAAFINDTLRAWASNDNASIKDLKDSLAAYFEDRQKADMIARTEVSRAAGYAQETVYKDAGATGKRWITAIDERVCEWCSELDGQIVDISDNFVDSGKTIVGSEGHILTADYGAIISAPAHPSCRCDLIPVFDGEKSSTGNTFKRLQAGLLELDAKHRELDQISDTVKEREEEIKKKEKELRQREKALSKKADK